MEQSRPRQPAVGEIRRLLLRHLPPVWSESDLADHLPLGADGLGLDSVGLVEFLLDCEKEWGLPFPAELLGQEGLSVGRVIAHFRQGSPGDGPGIETIPERP
jgi:acyl carrier protein